MQKPMQKILAFLLILFLILGLNCLIHINEGLFLNLKTYGYIGTFFACLILNATVLLPSSSTAVVMSMATVYNPVIIAFLGALGSTLGEFTGFFAGYYGRTIIENSTLLNKVIRIYDKFPKLALVFFAALPLPFFDVLGIVAGSVQMKKKTFLVLCFVGKCLKMLLYAYLGAHVLKQI